MIYEELFAKHGDSPEALGWSAHGQRARFFAIADFLPINGSRFSVLDVGSGLGHLFSFLDHRYSEMIYVGFDACPELVVAAMRNQSKMQGTNLGMCSIVNALSEVPLPSANYVVSSGMLNIETGTNLKDMGLLLRKCFDACTVGCAVNMLSTQSPRRREDRHYYDPADMFNEALSLTRHASLRHDYLDNDFTLCLYKEVRK